MNQERELGKKRLSEALDAAGGNREGRQDRKRKAAQKQGNNVKIWIQSDLV